MFHSSYRFAALVFAALFALCLAQTETLDGYSYVVSHLDKFQTSAGGFKQNDESKASLEATSHALFLSSLFGLRKRINSAEVARYIQTLKNGDYGYGKSAGLASDLESVRHAVLSYQHLGQTIPNSENVAKFIQRLYNTETRLFANRAGEKGDIKSTALAFQALEYLGELQRSWVQDIFAHVATDLSKHVQLGNHVYFSFPGEENLSVMSANYYGIVLASYVGFDFITPSKWASFIQSMQSAEGGFFTSLQKTQTSLESTTHAVSSLRILQQLKGQSEHFVDWIDTDKLMGYVSKIGRDLRSAAQAHLAVALTKSFTKNFDTAITYEVLRSAVPIDKRVVQGTQIKPILTVKTFDGVAHAGLDVEVSISYASSKEVVKFKLQWKDNEVYAADEFFDTSNQLGTITFDYVIRCYVVGVGEISFDITDTKQVGYGLLIDSHARFEVTGKDFQEGDTVPIGTDFTFRVTLQNQTNDEFTSGDFDVIFTALDSSLVAIATEKRDCRKNNAPISFSYSLKSSNIPGGDLSFRFDVANKNGVHTTEYVTYQLSIPMIATAITFEGVGNEGPRYKIGQTIKVSIEPASFPDLRTVHHYAGKDVFGSPAADKRHFFMDVSSPSGVLLRSVPGKAVGKGKDGEAKYVFEVPIAPTLDSIGNNIVSFHYVTGSDNVIALANYDSVYGELYEDTAILNYTVNAELHMADIKEKPSTEGFHYGNDITFKFRVKDTVSGQFITKGSNENANVYLSLKHQDENRARPFTSAFEAAKEVETDGVNYFLIKWAINPNAVQGPGFLTITAQDADGAPLDLYAEGSKQPVHYNVNIGGHIDVQHEAYSSSLSLYSQSAYVVQLSLSCEGKTLRDAQLRCSVRLMDSDKGTLVASGLSAATNDEAAYSVSWSLPHDQAASGRYVLKCFREVDRKRALEAREFLDQKKRREEALKGTAPETVEESKADIEESLEPLFQITLDHVGPAGKMPIRTELVVALVLGALFFFISYQKKHYIPKRK